MKTLKKLAGVAAAAALVGFAAPASAYIVGGIDFGVQGGSPSKTHLETASLAQTFISGAGQSAKGYGVISLVNGDATYCADGSSNCSLYYITDTTVRSFSNTYASLGNTSVTIYFSNAAGINLSNQDSLANLAFISGLTKWATLKGAAGVDTIDPGADQNAGGILTGASLSASGTGLLNVDKTDGLGIAAVENYLDTNTIGAFGGNPNADIAFTYSVNSFVLNPFDAASSLANNCSLGQQQVGDWCYQGTANFRGKTNPIPEPGSLALLGLGLAGAAVARRKVRSA